MDILSSFSVPVNNQYNLQIYPGVILLDHGAQGPLFNHQTHHLEQCIRCSHCRKLGIGVVGGSNLNNIRRDEIDAL